MSASWKINYLHIDADRTIQGAFQDFIAYLPFMEKGSFMTLHDTGPKRPCITIARRIKEMGYDVVNFESLGTGIALIYIPQQLKNLK